MENNDIRKEVVKVLMEDPNEELVILAESFLAKLLERSLTEKENSVLETFLDKEYKLLYNKLTSETELLRKMIIRLERKINLLEDYLGKDFDDYIYYIEKNKKNVFSIF